MHSLQLFIAKQQLHKLVILSFAFVLSKFFNLNWYLFKKVHWDKHSTGLVQVINPIDPKRIPKLRPKMPYDHVLTINDF